MSLQFAETGPQTGSKGCHNCAHRGPKGWVADAPCKSCQGYYGGYDKWKADPKTLAGYIEAIQKADMGIKDDPECRLGDNELKNTRVELNVTPVPSSDFDVVSNPSHYTEGRTIEPIAAIQDWELNFCLGNVVKYISRAGRKKDALEDLKKARFYLDYHIKELGK